MKRFVEHMIDWVPALGLGAGLWHLFGWSVALSVLCGGLLTLRLWALSQRSNDQ